MCGIRGALTYCIVIFMNLSFMSKPKLKNSSLLEFISTCKFLMSQAEWLTYSSLAWWRLIIERKPCAISHV